MAMLKLYGWAVLCFALSLVCAIVYWVGGGAVGPEGTLVETFAWVPLAWLFLFLGCVAAGITWWRTTRKTTPS